MSLPAEFKAKYPNKIDRSSQTEAAKSAMGFGYFDKKGREIGMIAWVWEVDVRPAADEEYGRTDREVGHYFVASTQTTRGGEPFGATQSSHYFKTVEERDVYLARRWLDSLKAAAKKAGK